MNDVRSFPAMTFFSEGLRPILRRLKVTVPLLVRGLGDTHRLDLKRPAFRPGKTFSVFLKFPIENYENWF